MLKGQTILRTPLVLTGLFLGDASPQDSFFKVSFCNFNRQFATCKMISTTEYGISTFSPSFSTAQYAN